MPTPSEKDFEDFICAYLADHAGYDAVKNDKEQAPPRDFDAVRGLDTVELFHFIGSTQIDDWNELLSRYGNDPNVAQAKFADRLASELDRRGVVDVLRNGVVDQGVTLQLCFFKPAFGLSPDLVTRYKANRVTATRQLRYDADAGASLDLSFFVNWCTPAPRSRIRSTAPSSSSSRPGSRASTSSTRRLCERPCQAARCSRRSSSRP